MSKILKTPKITSSTKLLSFDLETNGLHGQAFAIGALVMDGRGKIYEQFTARCPIKGELDQWVKDNVLPAITDMNQSHDSYEQMREAFWSWYMRNEQNSDYVIVSNGYPVEYRFLIDCQQAKIDERYWQHPFPLIELSSLLLGKGILDESIKRKLVNSATGGYSLTPHDPLDDAKATVLTAFAALE